MAERSRKTVFEKHTRQPTGQAISVVLLSLVLATVARLLLAPVLMERAPFVTYLIAVMFVGWYGGLIPALFAILASSLVGGYLFVPPYQQINIGDIAGIISWSMFALAGVVSAFLSDSLHEARARTRAIAEEAESNWQRLETERRERESAQLVAQEQRAWAENIADTMANILFTCRPDGIVDFVNKQFYEYTGLPEGTVLDSGWHESMHPDDAASASSAFARASLNKSPYEYEARLRGANGSYRWFIIRARPIINEHSQIVKWFGAATDIDDLKATEARLRENRYFTDRMAHAVPDVIYVIDLISGRTLYVNRAVETLLGYPPSLFEQGGVAAILDLIHPDDRAAYLEHNEQLVSADDQTVIEIEYRMRDVNSNWRWMYARDTVFRRDDKGQVQEVLGVGQDISDRKWVEHEYQYVLDAQQMAVRRMQEAHALLDAIFASAPVGLAFLDTDLRFRRINDALAKLNGFPVEAHFGQKPVEMLPDIEINATMTTLHHILDTRQPIEFEESGATPGTNGVKHSWIATYYPVILNEEVLGIGVIIVDITERKRSEERLQLLQDVTAALSQAVTPEHIAQVFRENALPAFEAHWGVLATLTEDRQALELVLPNSDISELATEYQHIPLETRLPLTDTVRENTLIYHADQESLIAAYPGIKESMLSRLAAQAAVALPLTVGEQTIGGLVLVFPKPISLSPSDFEFLDALAKQCGQAMERALLYRAEAQARADAETANTIKLKFLAMISHELRTPLASIKGFTSTMLAEDVAWELEKQREFLSIIDTEADRLAGLVEQLLDVSRLQVGTLRITPETQTFDSILATAMPQIEALVREHHLKLTIAPDLPPIHADHERIAQVLVNLVGNAVKYSPPDTTITLRVAADSVMLKVSVTDEGEGIPPEERESVFEAFRQIEKKSRQRGAGLGLAICKGVVEAHSGRIWIEDHPDPGTTISFTIPYAVERAAVPPKEA